MRLHAARRQTGGPADLNSEDSAGPVTIRNRNGKVRVEREYTLQEKEAIIQWSKWSPQKRDQVAEIIGWRPGETKRPS